jgi:hypothetical protein
MTILIALQSLSRRLKGQAVLIQSDNVTAVAQINKFGSASPSLTRLARTIHEHCWRLNIHLRAEHVPGTSLEVDKEGGADALSRRQSQYDFQINRKIFLKAEKLFGRHSIDAFASWTNSHVPTRFFTEFLDPSQMPVNAMLQDWSNDNLWMVPPWPLLPEVICKLRNDKATATIVVPYWPRQPWFRELMQMSTALPFRLPRQATTFQMASRSQTLKLLRWTLYCFRVSGMPTATTLSHSQLAHFFQKELHHTP